MKNLYYIVIFIVIILSGCKYNENPINSTKQSYDPNSEQKTVADELYAKNLQENTTEKGTKSAIDYVNNELGFGITFPAHWKEYYKVTDTEGGIVISFYGKSLAGRGATLEQENGLILFFILNEKTVLKEELDSVTKIGTAKGIDYYFATGRSFDLQPIALISDEELKRNLELYGSQIYNEYQIPLINNDWEKAQQMQNDIDTVIKSFTEI